MSTERNATAPSGASRRVAVDAAISENAPDHQHPMAGLPQEHDDFGIREREGLPANAVILAPALSAPRMRCPDDAWAMLVLAVDIIADADPSRPGDLSLFAGRWLPDQPAPHLHDGDYAVRLVPPADPPRSPAVELVDVELWQAYHDSWVRECVYLSADRRWPETVAPTLAVLMGLYVHGVERQAQRTAAPSSPLMITRNRHSLCELLDAGLIRAGEELVWDRCNGTVRHTARIDTTGVLRLADGSAYVNPTSAATALAGYPHNGWEAFRRMSDARTLADLRAELEARQAK